MKYPIGIQNFENLRNDGYVYVDKTRTIYNLVSKGAFYFLARPRRFGKSLLLSTLKAYFEGKKELFKGLAIYNLEKDWIQYPVLHLSLGTVNASEPDSVKSILGRQFSEWENLYGVENISQDYSVRFASIIKNAFVKTGKRVVILIDEYDNPLVNTISNNDLHERNRDLLKAIYSNLKDMGEYIKFGMLTGVSRFSKMSIFSGLNNLDDISFFNDFADICGITHTELELYLKEGILKFANSLSLSYENAIKSLKAHYDGYHFTDECPDIYNPFSLFSALKKGKVDSFWVRTGTPTFLVKRLYNENINLKEFLNSKATESRLAETDLAYSSILALLFQTGYLTIKGYDRISRRYQLGIPNKEVSEGLFENLLTESDAKCALRNRDIIFDMAQDARDGEPEKMMEKLRSYIAGIPYPQANVDSELLLENNLYIIFSLLGLDVATEYRTSNGRIDILINTNKYIYVIELKIDKSADEAINQIDTKKYTLQWDNDNRTVFKIGLNYSSRSRNIESWIIEEVKRDY